MRLVASAKSWLSYGGANRTAPILPWGAPAEMPQLSPVDASAEYLRHLARGVGRAASATTTPAPRSRSRTCSSPCRHRSTRRRAS